MVSRRQDLGVPASPSGSRPSDGAAQGVSTADAASIPNADDMPTVTHEGTVKIGDLEVRVLHLSNGERVIEEESFHALMDALFGEGQEGTR